MRFSLPLLHVVVISALGSVLAPTVRAQPVVLFDNLSPTPGGPIGFDSNIDLASFAAGQRNSSADGLRYAYRFTPAVTSLFDRIIMPLEMTPSLSPDVVVSILADNAGEPGTALFSRSVQPNPGSPALSNIFADPSSPLVLTEGTNYWVSVHTDAPFSFARWYASNFDVSTPGRSTIYAIGLQWTQTPPGSRAAGFRVDGIIPAPGTAALLGLGGLIAMRRRRA